MDDMNKKKIYVAGALTNVKEYVSVNKKELYENIASICSRLGFDVYVPHLSKQELSSSIAKNLTPKRIFEWDIQQVTEADIIIAYVGLVSLGVGIELGYAACLKIPVITLCEKGQPISPMILGHSCLVEHIEYRTEKDYERKLQQTLFNI